MKRPKGCHLLSRTLSFKIIGRNNLTGIFLLKKWPEFRVVLMTKFYYYNHLWENGGSKLQVQSFTLNCYSGVFCLKDRNFRSPLVNFSLILMCLYDRNIACCIWFFILSHAVLMYNRCLEGNDIWDTISLLQKTSVIWNSEGGSRVLIWSYILYLQCFFVDTGH